MLSRATVHVLKALSEEDLRILLDKARDVLQAPALSEAACARLLVYADGDARRLLNTAFPGARRPPVAAVTTTSSPADRR